MGMVKCPHCGQVFDTETTIASPPEDALSPQAMAIWNLRHRFDLGDLRTLSFELSHALADESGNPDQDVLYENIPGNETKEGLLRGLLLKLQRRSLLHIMRRCIARTRPDIARDLERALKE
jgi:hypothetical protein